MILSELLSNTEKRNMCMLLVLFSTSAECMKDGITLKHSHSLRSIPEITMSPRENQRNCYSTTPFICEQYKKDVKNRRINTKKIGVDRLFVKYVTDQTATPFQSPRPSSKTIFSFDGGGIRGVITSTICKTIDSELANSTTIRDSVDMFAGTSIGGVLASNYSFTDGISSNDMQNMFITNGENMFKQTWTNYLTFDLKTPKYYSNGRLELFNNLFSEKRLSDTNKDLICTGLNLNNKKPIFFKSRKAKTNEADDYFVSDVCMATTAAPTYFEPYYMQSYRDICEAKSGIFVADGGLVANNPSLCALAEGLKTYKDADVINLVSIGTGYADQTDISYGIDYSGDNLLSWAEIISDIAVSSPNYITQYIIDQLIYSHSIYKKINYYRLNICLDQKYMSMENTATDNIRALINFAESDEKLNLQIKKLCKDLRNE